MTGQPTVLHLTLASDAGGLSRYIIDLNLALRERGWNSVVAGDEGVWQDRFDAAGIEYIHIPLKAGLSGFAKSVGRVREKLAGRRVDLIHTHYRRATQLGRWLQRSLRSPANSRPPLLYTLHLSHINVSGLRRLFSDFGDHTHCASADAREWLVSEARVPEGRISLIPHGIDVETYRVTTPDERRAARARFGFADGDVVMCFVGRLDDPKNEAWLLDVDQALQNLGVKHVKFLLAGEGPHEAMLKARIEAEGRAGRVYVLGHQEPLPIYQASDLLLLPSSREGFSLVCAEAMSTGIPILRTRTSGTHELVIENVTGRSVPIDNVAFTAAAVMLAQDRELLKRLGHGAAEHVRRYFTFESQVRATQALYDKLTGLKTLGGTGARLVPSSGTPGEG
ncbi:MAG: glycosyltransferase family 4 protein [Tepidisphaeraceae bacterium]